MITQFTNQLIQTLQTQFDNYYKPQQQWSGIINIYITHKINILPKDHTFTSHRQNERQSCSTIQNRSAYEAHLQQGSTNPEYKSTQQDLTEILTDKLRNAGSGIQGIALTMIKVFLRKSSFNKILYIENFIRIIYKADTIRAEIMKLHIQHLHKPYSSSSY